MTTVVKSPETRDPRRPYVKARLPETVIPDVARCSGVSKKELIDFKNKHGSKLPAKYFDDLSSMIGFRSTTSETPYVLADQPGLCKEISSRVFRKVNVKLEVHGSRMVYGESGLPHLKNNIHDGQRKLLLSEIHFLSSYSSLEINTVLYIGAAPGTHIVYLCALFPHLKFDLYDSEPFDGKLTNHKAVTIYNRYFTDEDAVRYSRLQEGTRQPESTDSRGGVLLISDIRNTSVSGLGEREREETIGKDMEMQKQWVIGIKPAFSLLKFRLSFLPGQSIYFNGELYFQPWAKPASIEMRMVVSREGVNQLREYNHTHYEQLLFYHNVVIRECAKFHLGQPLDSVNDNFDTALEWTILSGYVARYRSASLVGKYPRGRFLVDSVLEMMFEISGLLAKENYFPFINPDVTPSDQKKLSSIYGTVRPPQTTGAVRRTRERVVPSFPVSEKTAVSIPGVPSVAGDSPFVQCEFIASFFPPLPSRVNPCDFKITKQGRYSATPYLVSSRMVSRLRNYYNHPIKTIMDLGSGTGSDTINFAFNFPDAIIVSYEPNPDNFAALTNNVGLYSLKNVKTIRNPYSKRIDFSKTDVLYMDPPWGGPEYKEKKELELYFGKKDEVKINVKDIAIRALNSGVKLVILKVPKNFSICKGLGDNPALTVVKTDTEKKIDYVMIHYKQNVVPGAPGQFAAVPVTVTIPTSTPPSVVAAGKATETPAVSEVEEETY